MKIAHLSVSDLTGGAARSGFRLHTGLLRLGHESTFSVQTRESEHATVIGLDLSLDMPGRIRRGIRRWSLRKQAEKIDARRTANAGHFTDDRSEHFATALKQLPDYDILNLHWVSGFLDLGEFFSTAPEERPIVWTLHDMNAFTGGCHYDNGCGRFTERCGSCPKLGSSKENDLSRAIWKRKRRAYSLRSPKNFHVVTPSNWMSGQVQRSSLLKDMPVTVIPYGLDTDIFKPRDRRWSREILGIPDDSHVILFLADWLGETRKGFSLLKQALEGIQDTSRLTLLMMGHGSARASFNIRSLTLGYFGAEGFLSMVYSAADLFILPTLEDNLPNTAIEAISCGVPVVAFNVGGIPEVIHDGQNGRLVPVGDVEGLRFAICDLLRHPETLEKMKTNAREVALQKYKLEYQAQRYVELYEAVVSQVSGDVIDHAITA